MGRANHTSPRALRRGSFARYGCSESLELEREAYNVQNAYIVSYGRYMQVGISPAEQRVRGKRQRGRCSGRPRNSIDRPVAILGLVQSFCGIHTFDIFEDCPIDVGFGEIRTCNVCAGQIGAGKPHAIKARAAQIGAL